MKLIKKCPSCESTLELVNEWKTSNEEIIKFYKCGHFFTTSPRSEYQSFNFNSLNGEKTAYQYQQDFLPFVVENNFSVLCADQMGLGKTVQGLLTLKNFAEEMGTCLILVRGATLWQWVEMYKEWTSNDPLGIFMIRGSKDFIPPGFKCYIMSMDTFSKFVTCEVNAYGRTISTYVSFKLMALKIKSVIVDECQSFKNPESLRSRALVGFLQSQNIEKKIFLSGTPIKNRADEYFVTLNLLSPEKFPSQDSFRRQYLQKDFKGKWSMLAPYAEDSFRKIISEFVIRREVKDVMKDLPEFRRTFETIYIEDTMMKEVYNKELQKLREKQEMKENLTWMDVSDSLMTLRRICGMAKVDFAVNYIDVFLDSTPDEKIAIGIHHKAVADTLYGKLTERGFKVLKLTGEDSSDQKEKIKQEFRKDENRILIISTLAGGVGMDGLQVCNNILVLERQWNSVDEEQFEARFHRNGQLRPVIAEYMIAKNTIDGFFSEMVEQKRHIFGKVVGLDYSLMGDSDSINELVEKTLGSKL